MEHLSEKNAFIECLNAAVGYVALPTNRKERKKEEEEENEEEENEEE